jgi:hypothetical protein
VDVQDHPFAITVERTPERVGLRPGGAAAGLRPDAQPRPLKTLGPRDLVDRQRQAMAVQIVSDIRQFERHGDQQQAARRTVAATRTVLTGSPSSPWWMIAASAMFCRARHDLVGVLLGSCYTASTPLDARSDPDGSATELWLTNRRRTRRGSGSRDFDARGHPSRCIVEPGRGRVGPRGG